MENEPLQPAPAPDRSELTAQYNTLHSLVMSVILLCIVIGGTFCIFLLRQARFASADLEMVKINYTNVAVQYERARPVMDEMWRKLQDFSRTNPDFAPILSKYRVMPTTSSTTSAAPARPAGKK